MNSIQITSLSWLSKRANKFQISFFEHIFGCLWKWIKCEVTSQSTLDSFDVSCSRTRQTKHTKWDTGNKVEEFERHTKIMEINKSRQFCVVEQNRFCKEKRVIFLRLTRRVLQTSFLYPSKKKTQTNNSPAVVKLLHSIHNHNTQQLSMKLLIAQKERQKAFLCFSLDSIVISQQREWLLYHWDGTECV